MSDTPRTDAKDTELHMPRILQDRYSEMLDHAKELERELKHRHDEYARALNRRVDVENVLAMVAAGKRDLLTREECRELAIKLGVSPK